MATAGDGWAPYESGGPVEKFDERALPSEINEEPQNFTQEAGQNVATEVSVQGGNSTSISSTIEASELERMWKLKNFTRSEVKHPTTMENLPGDLLLKIFILLLAKQLAQMRCVSKYWNALLSESSFIKSHLNHSIINNDRILLVFYHNSSYFDPKPYTAHPSRYPHPELTNFIKLPPVNPKSTSTTSMIEVIGSIHGLICSRDGDDVIHIWNPSLSAVSTVPPHSTPSCGSYVRSFLFGFDPKTDDYKIVKLTGLRGTSPAVVKEWLQVEVYSMRRGSWKSITQRFPSHLKGIFNYERVFRDGHDGHLHWGGYVSDKFDFETIVAFDLGSETFSEMSLPDSLLGSRQPPDVLGVWDGKPCVFTAVVTDAVFEVWVMEEYGVADSWVKRHSFSKFSCAGSFGLTLRNEILIEDNDGRLALYNPIANKTTIFKEFGYDIIPYRAHKVVEYVDSLVWVGPVQREMLDGAQEN